MIRTSFKTIRLLRAYFVAAGLLAMITSIIFISASSAEATPDWDEVGKAPISIPGDSTWFQVICNFSHSNNDDPIVFPGRQGVSHKHDFFGNTGTNFASTYKSLHDTESTSCLNTKNKSAYWAPALYKKGRKIDPIAGKFYYRADKQGNRDTQPFPAGLRMIAGNATATNLTPQPTSIVNWKCGTDNVYKQNSSAGLPTCTGTDVLHVWISFPNCWNGKDLDSPNHKSHMAYADKATGRCLDPNYPVRVPKFLQIYKYPTTGGINAGYTLGMPTLNYNASSPAMTGSPYSGHADFFSAWDQEEQVRLIQTCIWTQKWCDSNGKANGAIKTGDDTAYNPGMEWPPSGIKPYITQQPVATQKVFADNVGVLSANATGSLPISYQWMKNGRNISGETKQTLVVSNPNVNDKYSVKAVNAWGSDLSNEGVVQGNGSVIPPTTTTTMKPTTTTTQQPTTTTTRKPGTVITCSLSIDPRITPDISKLYAPAKLKFNTNVSGLRGSDIDRVELLLNGRVLTTDDSEPFEFYVGGIKAASKVYVARVVPKAGSSVMSNTIKLTVHHPSADDTIAPSAVSGLKSTVTYETSAKRNHVVLTWNAARDNVGVVRYVVFKNGRYLTSTTSRSVTNHIYATGVHYYRVVAVDAAGNGGPGVSIKVAAR